LKRLTVDQLDDVLEIVTREKVSATAPESLKLCRKKQRWCNEPYQLAARQLGSSQHLDVAGCANWSRSSIGHQHSGHKASNKHKSF
jgi:hypothetical protein